MSEIFDYNGVRIKVGDVVSYFPTGKYSHPNTVKVTRMNAKSFYGKSLRGKHRDEILIRGTSSCVVISDEARDIALIRAL